MSSERDQRVARVRPDLTAVAREFDYEVPDALVDAVRVGTVVRVPLHGRRVRGWVVADDVVPDPGAGRLLPIAKVVGAGPPAELLELGRWAAHRWAGSEVALFRAATAPNAVRDPWPDPRAGAGPGFSVETVAWPPAADRRELVASHLAPDGSSLVLVPEGARLGALVRDLVRRGHRVLVLRSELEAMERTRAWAASRRGSAVVVGGRTAVWAPLPDLAAVVVLDEGDEALQEERVPTWHARDVALERARRVAARVTLVAPLPTPEAAAWTDGAVTRPERRVERGGWPAVDVVDQRTEPPGNGLLSEGLARALHRTVDAGERAVCVLNRKGRAKLLTCLSCSTVATCERCEAAVIEMEAGVLTCPRCGTTRPTICTACHHTKLRASRLGVQRLRDALAALLPRTEIAWLDASVEDVPDAPVVVGTEAVLHRIPAKLVAFLDLDQELFAHRVRAGQQAAGLLARSARLVGARERGGRMLLQTHAPDHPVVQFACDGDPEPLLRAEIARREVLAFPPFGAVAEVSGEADAVRAALAALPAGVRVLGPSERGTGLAALTLAPDTDTLADALAVAEPIGRAEGRVRIAVDPPRV